MKYPILEIMIGVICEPLDGVNFAFPYIDTANHLIHCFHKDICLVVMVARPQVEKVASFCFGFVRSI